jgi:preprotein translocase subunit YajC
VKWRKARIEEVAERVAMGPFGSSIKVETFVPNGVPVISGQHLHGSKVDDRIGFNFVSEEHADRLKNANVQRGDVVFTHAGNIGQVAFIPPEQRAIAHILGTLDDKIELNRRMNATLEAMARALFKSWFVDFDPVRAKMEGRDPGLPQALADLFPARLVDSELGEIPEGWEV